MAKLVASIVLFATLLPGAIAQACGGFFCNNATPVVQKAERILFFLDPQATVPTMTTVVEIQFEGAGAFGWVLPIPEAINPASVTTAPAGLFDELERRTAPRFERPARSAAAAGGSGCGGPWDGGSDVALPDTSGVTVVGKAVAGPYAIEVIEANRGTNLRNWLLASGYQIPFQADAALQYYVDRGAAFLGVKLSPSAPAGPLEALVFTCPGEHPMIPLVLTSVAAVSDMEIVTYVLADHRYGPRNFAELEFDHAQVKPLGSETTYLPLLREALDRAGGRTFETELAAPTARLADLSLSSDTFNLLTRARYLTRMRTFLSPDEMSEDPWFEPTPRDDDVSNVHELGPSQPVAAGVGAGLWVPSIVFAAAVIVRRARSRR